MTQRKSKQQKQEQRFVRETWFCIIILFLAGLLFSAEAINHYFTLNNWNTKGTLEYTGGYSLSERHYLRNTHYIFALNNGNVISVPSERILQIVNSSDHPILSFKYCRYKSAIHIGTYDGISIETPGGAIHIQNANVTQKSIRAALPLYTILGTTCLSFVTVLAVILIHRQKRCKRKGRV